MLAMRGRGHFNDDDVADVAKLALTGLAHQPAASFHRLRLAIPGRGRTRVLGFAQIDLCGSPRITTRAPSPNKKLTCKF